MGTEISVVIPTRNNAERLSGVLASLVKQSLSKEKFEVLVIDNGSTDFTKHVCDSMGRKFKNFRYIYDPNPGLHIGRNVGYRHSSSEIITYADDDIIASSGWLEAILEGFKKHEDAVLIGGNDIPYYEEQVPEWLEQLWVDLEDGGRLLPFFSCILFGEDEREIDPNYVFGCNFSIRRSILEETCGFHPDGMPDNLLHFRGDGESYVSDYIKSKEYKAFYIPGASVHHIVSKKRMTLQYIRRIAYRNGISMAYQGIRTKELGKLRQEIKKRKINVFLSNFLRTDPYKCYKKETEGMQFLLRHYEKNDAVREWIHRPNYLDEMGYVPENVM